VHTAAACLSQPGLHAGSQTDEKAVDGGFRAQRRQVIASFVQLPPLTEGVQQYLPGVHQNTLEKPIIFKCPSEFVPCVVLADEN
jgi:hypothetical protein